MTKNKISIVIISAILLLSAGISAAYLLLPRPEAEEYVADIYQEGRLLYSIPLDGASDSLTLTVESADGGRNEIQIRSRSVGVISADCPDRLCVRQGFISDSKLPVVCLPNRLVIQLRAAESPEENAGNVDIVSY